MDQLIEKIEELIYQIQESNKKTDMMIEAIQKILMDHEVRITNLEKTVYR
jgi:hypothetical protein